MEFPQALYSVAPGEVNAFPPQLYPLRQGQNTALLAYNLITPILPPDAKRVQKIECLYINCVATASATAGCRFTAFNLQLVDVFGVVLGTAFGLNNALNQPLNSFGTPGITTAVNANFQTVMEWNWDNFITLPPGVGLQLQQLVQTLDANPPASIGCNFTAIVASWPIGSIAR